MNKLLSSQNGLSKIGILFFIIEFIRKFATMPRFYEPNLLEIFYILNLFTIFFGSISALYNDKIWGRRLNIFGYTFLVLHPVFFIILNLSLDDIKDFFHYFFSPFIIFMAPGYFFFCRNYYSSPSPYDKALVESSWRFKRCYGRLQIIMEIIKAF